MGVDGGVGEEAGGGNELPVYRINAQSEFLQCNYSQERLGTLVTEDAEGIEALAVDFS